LALLDILMKNHNIQKGILYNTIMDHIKANILDGKSLSSCTQEQLEIALANLEDVRVNFTKQIVTGILGGRKNA
ncbi:unnamed protein product, partial [marine sediment metagenome]